MGTLWFIAGVDTGVGKTAVTVLLTRALVAYGKSTIALKPVETGCRQEGDRLIGEDASALAAASGTTEAEVSLYRYALPAAASVAARESQTAPVHLGAIGTWVQTFRDRYDLVLVEGAGGLMSPLGDKETVLDMARLLNPDLLILVAPNRLGVISHVITAQTALQRWGLPLSAVILNQVSESTGLAERTNLKELQHWIRPVLWSPWIPTSQPTLGTDLMLTLLASDAP